MDDIKKEALIWLTKWWTYLVFIFMGTVAKISYDILKKKTLTWAYVFATLGLSWTVGGVSAVWCMKYHPDYTPFVVPLATLFSDKILIWFTSKWDTLAEVTYKLFIKRGP